MPIETLIDNIQNNTLRKTLETLLPQSVSLDVATGTFEIGAFLSLGETWQHLDGIRLLMGRRNHAAHKRTDHPSVRRNYR